MNARTTWCLGAVALALLAYIYFVDLRRPDATANGPRGGALLPHFDPAGITSVEVTRSNETIRAELANDQWQLATPRYPAQATAIDSLLQTLTSLQRQQEIPANEIISQSGGLSPFGLDPPWAVIKLQSNTNSIQFRVGSKTLLGDGVYVQPAGATGIFTTDASLLEHLPASASAWRNPMLIHQSSLPFDRIAITAGSRPLKLELDRTNQLWRLVEPPPTRRADFGRVEYLLQQLRSARVSEFVTDSPKADLEPFGLLTPEAELTLSLGSNTVCQIQFGKSPTNDAGQVYARRLSHTNVVLVPRELADLILKPYTEFRDRAVVSFRPGLVDRIEAQADEAFAIQRQSDNDWQIVEPIQAPADRQLMRLFLEDLAKLEIIRFEKDVVADFGPYGLVNPTRRYVLKTSVTNAIGPTNQTLVQVDFGNMPPDEPDKVFCRRPDETSVYVVASADMLRLERSAFTLRDRHIWSFAASNVTSVTVLQRGAKVQLVRDPATRKWDRENVPLNAAIEETLHRLGTLQADSWSGLSAAQAGAAEGRYELQIDLNEGGQVRQLKLAFGKLAASGQPYAAVPLEQGRPVVFKFPAELFALVAEYLRVPTANTEP